MRALIFFTRFLAASLLLAALAGCSGNEQNSGAAAAIEAYNQALVEQDANLLSTLSCAAWEAEAQTELASFGAVETTLEDMDCEESFEEGEVTLVSCTGVISANYNGEILEIDLTDRAYQAVFEGGEWRMCGYRDPVR